MPLFSFGVLSWMSSIYYFINRHIRSEIGLLRDIRTMACVQRTVQIKKRVYVHQLSVSRRNHDYTPFELASSAQNAILTTGIRSRLSTVIFRYLTNTPRILRVLAGYDYYALSSSGFGNRTIPIWTSS